MTSEIAYLVRNALYKNLGIKFENEYISKCNPTICIIFFIFLKNALKKAYAIPGQPLVWNA